MEHTAQTYCHNIPTVETALRCNKCGEYICPKCAVRTPTGYSCKSCISNQQKVFDNSNRWMVFCCRCGRGAFVHWQPVGRLLRWITLFLGPRCGGRHR